MNLAVFAVIVARERETEPRRRHLARSKASGARGPLLAWPLTIGMLALAGLPGTAGFMGKLYLIEATVEGDYTWLGVAIVIGTMVSLAYYLRVVAAVWMTSAATSSASRPGVGRADRAGCRRDRRRLARRPTARAPAAAR